MDLGVSRSNREGGTTQAIEIASFYCLRPHPLWPSSQFGSQFAAQTDPAGIARPSAIIAPLRNISASIRFRSPANGMTFWPGRKMSARERSGKAMASKTERFLALPGWPLMLSDRQAAD